jgi:hypothetical protein
MVDIGTGGVMIVWLFGALWHAVLGLVLVIGFFGGAVLIIAREIGKGAAHDFAKCQCRECMGRRDTAYKKRKRQEEAHKKSPVRTGWTSTEQLRTADRVASRNGIVYEVTALVPQYGVGVQVSLTALATKRKSIVIVNHERMQKPLWKLVN